MKGDDSPLQLFKHCESRHWEFPGPRAPIPNPVAPPALSGRQT